MDVTKIALIIVACVLSVQQTVYALADGAVRLVNGSKQHEGRVEIYHGGHWGTVCDDSWDLNDASVVCSQLGYMSATSAKGRAYFGQGRKKQPIFLDNVRCTGFEETLADCAHSGWGVQNCSHREDAGVVCNTLGEDKIGDIRLVGSYMGRGRVEIYHNNGWGTVCHHSWDLRDATVVCGQLSFMAAAMPAEGHIYFTKGDEDQPILLDNVGCTGFEATLADCYHDASRIASECTHDQDVGVFCVNPAKEGSVRLVSGSNKMEGRVEIYHNDEWGTICDDFWDITDAYVVCRQLGFQSAISAPARAFFGGGDKEQPIFLGYVSCTGNETALIKCASKGGSRTDCDHTEDAGVVCTDDESKGKYRPTHEHTRTVT